MRCVTMLRPRDIEDVVHVVAGSGSGVKRTIRILLHESADVVEDEIVKCPRVAWGILHS